MSASIPIYVVPENELRSSAGSRDSTLLDRLAIEDTSSLATLPDSATAFDIMNTLIGRPPLRRAVKRILRGSKYRAPSRDFYVCAYELMCKHFSFGYFEHWIQVARGSNWLSEVQTTASEIGLNLDYNQLAFGGSLIDLPADEFADIHCGFWTAAEVQSNKVQVDQYLASELCESETDPMRQLNYPIHDTAQWLDAASQRKDGAVVAFYI